MAEERMDATHARPRILNEVNAKAALPGDVLWDPKVKGLHLRALATKKVFYLYFRTKLGTERKPRLGDYGAITLGQAQTAAKELLGQVAAGRDPVAEWEAAKNAPTMDALWKRYREDRGLAKKTEKEDERKWNKYLAKFHTVTQEDGSKTGTDWRVKDVTYEEVAKVFQQITKENGPYMANRVAALLSTVMGFAVAPLRWIDVNPVEGLQFNPEPKRKRYAKGWEYLKIGERLYLEAKDNPASVAFLWLLILSGARKGEIAKAKWSQLTSWEDEDTGKVVGKITLTEHKTDKGGDERVIHLGPEAMDVVSKLPRTFGTVTGVKDPKKLWAKILADSKIVGLRMHDMRHTFASEAISIGYNLAQSGELLGHSSEATTKRYAHLIDEAATEAATKIGGSIAAKMRLA